MADDNAITRKDLIDMEERLVKHIDARIEKVDTRIDKVDARIEKVETTLLTEFHKWASPVDSKSVPIAPGSTR